MGLQPVCVRVREREMGTAAGVQGGTIVCVRRTWAMSTVGAPRPASFSQRGLGTTALLTARLTPAAEPAQPSPAGCRGRGFPAAVGKRRT